MIRERMLTIVVFLVVVTATVTNAYSITDSPPVTPLFSVEDIISDQTHPYWEWVNMVQGRLAKNSYMSASIWSLNTEANTALVVSAIHTLGEGYLGPGGNIIEERLGDPDENPGATRIYLAKEDRSVDSHASVLFILYNPEVPSEQSGNHLTDILPRHDFFVGVIDSQKVVMEPLPGSPASLKHEPPIIYDPSDLTTDAPTAADINPDDSVLLIGYPREGNYAGSLAASIGRVLSDSEAEDAIVYLDGFGDEEGGISYDSEVEMIIEGYSVVGMSGGGVFDREGRQVGVLVRASYMYDGKQYVRAVRMTFVVSSINSAYENLSELERAVVGQYLEPMPMSTLTALPIQTPSPSPAPQPKPDGIPGFPVASVLTGLAFMILIQWYHSYTY